MQARLKIGIVGPGRVGRSLAVGWQQVGHQVVAVTSSSRPQVMDSLEVQLPHAQVVALDQMPAVDLLAITTPDDVIGSVTQSLADFGIIRPGQIVLHASGAHGLAVLEPAAKVGALTIALHPAMTFTGYSLDQQRLADCPVAVTASAVAMPIAQALVYELQATPVPVEESQRQLYHAALTHGANHLFTLLTQARAALAAAGIEDPGAYLRPLLQATMENALEADPGSLTGPVVRADLGTLRTHLTQLQACAELNQRPLGSDPGYGLGQAADTYLALAEATAELAWEAGRLSDRQRDAVLLALRDTP
ncbi:MAG: DUF2520 domain-containing protein [Actinomycetaceae bacterium]|nr:DUF2520 domain-containing protein [Actinomycetaceae bacterium]